MKKTTDNALNCDICQAPFKMGATIYIFNLAMVRKDLCTLCKNDVLSWIEKATLIASQFTASQENEAVN